jgi:hypothetical protein
VIELLIEAERALSFGLLDRAEQLYRQVASNDPKNAIAVVGLARVAIERGDDLGAYLHGRKAIAIDPENESARRLVERLEEVMRTRGDDVPDLPEIPRRPSVVPPSMAPGPPGSRAPDRSVGVRSSAPPSVPQPPAQAPEPGDAPPHDGPADGAAAASAGPERRGPRRSLLDRLRRR